MSDYNFLARESSYTQINLKWNRQVSEVREKACGLRDQSCALQLGNKTWSFRLPWNLEEMAYLMDESADYSENFFDKSMFCRDPRVQEWKLGKMALDDNETSRETASGDIEESEEELSTSSSSFSLSYSMQYEDCVFGDTAHLEEDLLGPLQTSLMFPFVQGICSPYIPCKSYKDCTSLGKAFPSLADMLENLISDPCKNISIASLETEETLYGPELYFAYLNEDVDD